MLYLKLTQEDFDRNFHGESYICHIIEGGNSGRQLDGTLYRDIIGRVYEIKDRDIMVEISDIDKDMIKEAREILEQGDKIIVPFDTLGDVHRFTKAIKTVYGVGVVVRGVDKKWEVVAQKRGKYEYSA